MQREYRPFAPALSVSRTFRRMRSRNLPTHVDLAFLGELRIPVSVRRRVRHTIEFLGLIDQYGQPQLALKRLVRAKEGRYRGLLADQVRSAYDDIFREAHPDDHSLNDIVNAFQPFEPASQHYRMAVLFLGLCRESNIQIAHQPRLIMQSDEGREQREAASTRNADSQHPVAGNLPKALENSIIRRLTAELPTLENAWSVEECDEWLADFSDALRYVYKLPPA